MSVPYPRAGACLTIDLNAIRANYRALRALGADAGADCAGVLKADASADYAYVAAPLMEQPETGAPAEAA